MPLGTGFLFGNLPLPAAKTDDHPSSTPLVNTYTANDWNLLRQYLSDVRAGFTGGADFLTLANNPTAALALVGLASVRQNGTFLQASLSGGRYQTLNPSLLTVNVSEFGAVGDGVADDTVAFQNALNVLSGTGNGIGANQGKSGVLVVPSGTYKITSTLNYIGNASVSLWIKGESTDEGARQTCLLWYGAAGGVMFKPLAMNNGLVENIAFDGRGLAQYCVQLDTNQPAGGGSSDFNRWSRCVFTGPQNLATAACFAIAHVQVGTTHQIDSNQFDDCIFNGAGQSAPAGHSCVVFLMSGNAKLHSFNHCHFLNSYYGISGVQGTTSPVVVYGGFGGNLITFVQLAPAQYTLIGVAMEGVNRCFDGSTGNNPGSLTMIGCYNSSAPPDDTMGNFSGCVTLIGCWFANSRTTSSLPKFQLNAPGPAPAGVTSFRSQGCFYMNAVGNVPLYDSNGNDLVNSAYATSIPILIYSEGDIGGWLNSGTTNIAPLTPIEGRPAQYTSGKVFPASFDGASPIKRTDILANGEPNRYKQKVTIPNSYWTMNAATGALGVASIPAKAKLVSVIADTTQAYAGTGMTGTIQLQVSKSSLGGQDFILNHDVKTAAITKGLADADLGTAINRANAVQGGVILSWTTAIEISAQMTISVGTLGNGTVSNFTGGSTTFYIEYEIN